MGVIALALVGAVLLMLPGSPIHRKLTKGLDLQGGLEVVLQAVPPKNHKLTAEDLDRSVSIMQKRINGIGVSEPEIRKQGKDQIVIQLAGVHDPAAAAKLIGKTAQLMLFDFEKDLTGPSVGLNGNPVATPSLYDLLSQVQKQAAKGSPEAYYLFRVKTVHVKTKKKTTVTDKKGHKTTILKPSTKTKVGHSLVQSASNPATTLKELLKPYGGKTPPHTQVLKVPQHMIVASCAAKTGCLGAAAASPSGNYHYLLKFYPDRATDPVPEMTGADLVLSGTRADVNPSGSGYVVTLQFTGHGSKQFQKITRDEAQRGETKFELAGKQGDPVNFAQHFAIVLDQQLESTPYIDFQRNPDGIPGPNAEIDLGQGGSFKEAKDLALVLQTGALPVTFRQIERTDVSATLGKDSFKQALLAAAVGLAIVAIFLLVLYRFLGLVAVVGLAIYAAFYVAAILLFNVTLTLPGFAGLILTIGVAADANVVVFERIKEEVRAGKSVRAAIAAGYGKGFHTILDANVVTAITALVLFLIAVASVKGFALMLLIGTIISLVTAVAATRAMLGLLAGFRWFDNPRFMGAHGQQTAKWLQIDFMRRRYWWFALSGVVIVAGAASLGARGLNLGIDFKGGTQFTFKTHKAFSTDQVHTIAARVGQRDAIVQGRGKALHGDYTTWQIRTRSLKPAAQNTLSDNLNNQLGAYATGVKNVSSSFGHQIAIDAIWGIIVSLILIVIYIALRFDLKFSVPVILAMLHDIVITVGVYSLAFKEVSVATVAAVLTVLGYSIYDTIIIFDRVRENIPLMRRQPFATIMNVSLWETIRRSLATTFITLLPVAALLVLGGATLKDFAFALLVGVTSGAYSSIFIAAPLLTMWKEREPEYAKRRQVTGAAELAAPVVDGGRRRRGKVDPGTAALQASEQALAAEPTPELVDVVTSSPSEPSAQARREKRRQRRRTRPHGRAR
ncbi:MAG: SecD/SecF fusion protein [Actinomycetota bacterium]